MKALVVPFVILTSTWTAAFAQSPADMTASPLFDTAAGLAPGAAQRDQPPALSTRPWHVTWQESALCPDVAVVAPDRLLSRSVDAQPAAAQRPRAVEYSDAYTLRRKIHVYASIATLPLFVTEFALGQKLYNGNYGEGTKSAHGAVAGVLAGLFAVNSVTGVWNLWEGRNDPSHRTKRLVHGIMMLGADAGFLATAALAPDFEEGRRVGSGASTHRAVAITSMGVATASYLMMLLTR